MYLTDHELTAASSVIAALAIVGGYLGVRSANNTAVKIAREASSTRRQDELNAVKLQVYAKFFAALQVLRDARYAVIATENGHKPAELHVEQEISANHEASNLMSQIELIAGSDLRQLGTNMFQRVLMATDENALGDAIDQDALFDAMRDDLGS